MLERGKQQSQFQVENAQQAVETPPRFTLNIFNAKLYRYNTKSKFRVYHLKEIHLLNLEELVDLDPG